MKTFQLLDKFWFGGAERVALSYHAVLSRSHFSIIFALLHAERHPENGVQLFSSFLVIFRKLHQYASQERILLFAHTTRTLVLSCILKIFHPRNVKIVHIRHFQYTNGILLILRLLRIFICKEILINHKEESRARSVLGNRVQFIHNFIVARHDKSILAEKIAQWADGRIIIAFAGAFKSGKNPHHMVNLSEYLDPDIYALLVIGDGPEMPSFRENMHQFSDYNRRFFLTGFRNDVDLILQEAKYFFFPSWNNYEMNPMVLLEAQAAGCRCIAYNMKINQEFLPAANLFSCSDFESIANAIKSNRLEETPLLFNDQYGEQVLNELRESLLHP